MLLQSFVVGPQLVDATKKVTVNALMATGNRWVQRVLPTTLIWAFVRTVQGFVQCTTESPATGMETALLSTGSVDASPGGQAPVARYSVLE